jgi:hypothetical protein
VLLRRYLFTVVAALAVALGAAGGVLAGNAAKGHPPKAHAREHAAAHPAPSLMPSLAPPARAWAKALHPVPHKRAPQPHKRQAHPQPVRHHAPARSVERQQGTTLSIYEQTAKPWVLSAQGCSAARRHERGIVILDFGKPAFKRHGYGTILFSGHFALNHKITTAMVGYARGYVSCLPHGSKARITLARGTSNYSPSVPSAYAAGLRWARATNKLGRILRRHGLAAHVETAAADDAEPAWDRSFRQTRDFFHGFRAATRGHTLYDYGSLDGGVGVVWSARQAWYVAGGIRHTKALPEIYNSEMARQWAELARIARRRYHRPVRFAGVMTQGTESCGCGLRPSAAHRVLAHALDDQGVGHVGLPDGGTNIVG